MDILDVERGANDGTYRFSGMIPASESGGYGFNVRVIPTHPRLNAQDRQFFRAVGAQHEDTLNVAGAAWTGDERDETWIVRCVFVPQQRERGGQVREELLPTGEDNVVWGQR